ncbi:MAG: MBL fold metallo-hydrolase [Candidatus Doudnabacteria bacterium]
MLIEEQGVRLLTDPGTFTQGQNELENIDAVLITHEHQDHFHIDSLKEILKKNPQAVIITTAVVSELIRKDNLDCLVNVVEHGQSMEVEGLLIEGFGEKHALFHSSMPQSTNVGFLIAGRLFYPGDAFTNPHKAVEILALPVAGPWMKIGEAIDYALELRPRVIFPVHDGVLKNPGMMGHWLGAILPKESIKYIQIDADQIMEF